MISFFIFYAIILCKEDKNMKPNIEELRKKYMDHPPEGFTSEDIRNMSEDELLDMDYFHARPCAGYFHSGIRRKSNFPIK